MKTDIIQVNSELEGHEAAVDAAERFSVYNNISGKEAMHIRLLTEETLSLVHGILDDFTGNFWLETEHTKKGLLCRLCLSADKLLNRDQESQFLSVSTSGRNENARGILGRIREVFRQSLQTESGTDDAFLQNMADAWAMNGTSGEAFWSLQSYRQSIAPKKESAEWDELEKSIIAKLADEVKVWLKSDVTEIAVEKYIARR